MACANPSDPEGFFVCLVPEGGDDRFPPHVQPFEQKGRRSMKFEFNNGTFVGTAEWQAPGRVEFDVPERHQREYLERYFATPYFSLGGAIDCPEMQQEDPESSPEFFARAAHRLAERDYDVRRIDAGFAKRGGA